MWIASALGFFSIVKKDGAFHVRARCRIARGHADQTADYDQSATRNPAQRRGHGDGVSRLNVVVHRYIPRFV